MDRVTQPDALNRCQGVTANGQCTMQALEESSFCKIHGGARAKVGQIARYRAEQWRAKLEEQPVKIYPFEPRF